MAEPTLVLIGQGSEVIDSFLAAGWEIVITSGDVSIPTLTFQTAVIAPDWLAEKSFLDTTRADWDAAIEDNIEWMITIGQAIARRLIALGKGGRIIYLSSVAALKSLKNYSIAGTTLAALHVIAQMAAVDLAPHAITVNVIARGWDEFITTPPIPDDAPIGDYIPTGRLLQHEDVGALCVFLASDAAKYITGAVIPVDGGYTLTKAR